MRQSWERAGKETLHGLSPPIFWSEVKSLSHVWLSVTPWTVCSPTGSSVHGIFQARVLEWVAISFSRGSSQPRDRTGVSCIVGRCFTKPQGSLTPCYNLQLLNPNGSQKGSWLMPTLRDNYQGYTTGLLLLSRFSRVWLCATPQAAAHQATPSLGFSRQEYWSGLPFPSPVHESEVAQLCPTLSDHMDCSPPGSSVHGIFQARVLEWGAIAFSGRWWLQLWN